MVRDTIVAPLVQERPSGGMARAVLERLVAAPRLDALCARPAPQQYPRALRCASLGPWMREVVRGGHPTVHAASQAHTATIGGAPTALDNQRDRGATGVAAALVRAAAALAEPVGKAWPASQPRWVPGDHSQGLTGKHGSAPAHRLQA